MRCQFFVVRFLFLLFGWFLLVSLAPAPVPTYEIPWSSVNGGGGTVASGQFVLTSSAGQSCAGFAAGGAYAVDVGFLAFLASSGSEVTSYDVLQHLLGAVPLSGAKLSAADANIDGVIDAADVVKLISQGK